MDLDLDLTDRQSRYLLAAFDAAPKAGESFDYLVVGAAAGFDHADSDDLLQVLGAKGLIGPLSYGKDQTLTAHGRELAHHIRATTTRVALPEPEQLFLLGMSAAGEYGQDYPYEANAPELGISEEQAKEIADKFLNYGFAKAASFGSVLITVEGEKAAEVVRQHRAKEAESKTPIVREPEYAVPKELEDTYFVVLKTTNLRQVSALQLPGMLISSAELDRPGTTISGFIERGLIRPATPEEVTAYQRRFPYPEREAFEARVREFRQRIQARVDAAVKLSDKATLCLELIAEMTQVESDLRSLNVAPAQGTGGRLEDDQAYHERRNRHFAETQKPGEILKEFIDALALPLMMAAERYPDFPSTPLRLYLEAHSFALNNQGLWAAEDFLKRLRLKLLNEEAEPKKPLTPAAPPKPLSFPINQGEIMQRIVQHISDPANLAAAQEQERKRKAKPSKPRPRITPGGGMVIPRGPSPASLEQARRNKETGTPLTTDMKAWLVAAYTLAGPDGEGFYSTVDVRWKLGLSEREENHISITLSRCNPLITELASYPQARLTDIGREWARELTATFPLTTKQRHFISTAYQSGPTGKPISFDECYEAMDKARGAIYATPEGDGLAKSMVEYLSNPPFAFFQLDGGEQFHLTPRGRDVGEQLKPKGLPPIGWLEKHREEEAKSKFRVHLNAQLHSDRPEVAPPAKNSEDASDEQGATPTPASIDHEAILGKLSPNAQKLLAQAYAEAPNEGDEFHYKQVALRAGLRQPSSHEIVVKLRELGLVEKGPFGTQQKLTALGRELGKRLLDEQGRTPTHAAAPATGAAGATEPLVPIPEGYVNQRKVYMRVAHGLADEYRRFVHDEVVAKLGWPKQLADQTKRDLDRGLFESAEGVSWFTESAWRSEEKDIREEQEKKDYAMGYKRDASGQIVGRTDDDQKTPGKPKARSKDKADAPVSTADQSLGTAGKLWAYLKESARALPVNKLAIGVAGLAALLGLGRIFLLGNVRYGFVGLFVVVTFMAVLLVLSWAQKYGAKSSHYLYLTLLWVVLAAFSVCLALLISTAFFGTPEVGARRIFGP